MILESKFIEGTNNQYSIRNDGVVFSHYLDMRAGRVYKDRQIFVDRYNSVSIYVNKKKITRGISLLLFDYFGYRLCNTCNNPLFIRKDKVCSSCQKTVQTNLFKKLYKERPEIYKAKGRRGFKTRKEKITKCYIACCLRIPTEDITGIEEKAYRHRLTLKRKIKQLQNGQEKSHL